MDRVASLLRLFLIATFLGGPMVTAVSPLLAQQGGFVPVEALRQGGYVLLFRYTTVQLVQEPSPIDLANCAVQHRLTEKGREEARSIGVAFRTLGIPVGRVLASPYCRALEMARLAFGRAEPWDALIHPTYVPIPGATILASYGQRVEAIKRILATPPAVGTNNVLVTHGLVVRAATGFDIAMGEAAFYRPGGDGGSLLVARVLHTHWDAAAAAYGVGR